jgi:hypothetical protein
MQHITQQPAASYPPATEKGGIDKGPTVYHSYHYSSKHNPPCQHDDQFVRVPFAFVCFLIPTLLERHYHHPQQQTTTTSSASVAAATEAVTATGGIVGDRVGSDM